MPIELSDLLNNERWVEVEIEGDILKVAYRPGATGISRQAEIAKQMRQFGKQEDADEEEIVKHSNKVFCEIVCDWDFTEDGETLPVTPEIVGRLPTRYINLITDAIAQDIIGNQEEKKGLSATSGVPSPRAGKRAANRNGIHSSEPQGTWA